MSLSALGILKKKLNLLERPLYYDMSLSQLCISYKKWNFIKRLHRHFFLTHVFLTSLFSPLYILYQKMTFLEQTLFPVNTFVCNKWFRALSLNCRLLKRNNLQGLTTWQINYNDWHSLAIYSNIPKGAFSLPFVVIYSNVGMYSVLQ